MNYIVLDLEWNQSPTGKADEIKTIPFEIIEIGAVKLNEQQEILDQFSEMINTEHKIFIKTAKVYKKNFPAIILHDKIRKIHIQAGFLEKTVIK